MTLVDDRGRVAGRVNLVDAVVAIVILVVVPLAYGAYLLFKTPPPKLAGVSPARLYEGHNQRVQIEGTNLRPFMRASFNTIPGKTFLIGSTKYAVVDVPDLQPGTYDVVLYDYAQEVDRLPKALTVVPMATDVELEVVGSFKSVPASLVAQLKVGDRFPQGENAIAEVVALGAPIPGDLRLRIGDETLRVPTKERELPATLRVKCYTARKPDGTMQCMVPGAEGPSAVAPDTMLTLASPQGLVTFQIAAVRAPTAPSPGSR